jgi:parallel beta-helix repeat protein
MNARFGGRSHGWWRRVTLLDAVVFTTPLLVLALWLFGSAVLDYRRIRRFDDWWSRQTSVRKFGYYRARTALRSFEMNELAKSFSAEREDAPRLRILVDREEFDRLDDNVAEHWGEWVDVQLLDAGDTTDARLRFRGDGSAHWTSEKKSFTLRTGRDELYKGFRTLAFSVKDVLPQWLVGTLAKDFGLLAPEQQIVPVYLNEQFYGLHRFVEPVDESFLRRNLCMPGNIFRADTAERGDYFKGLPREVFANPHIWDRVANNDRPGAFGTALLEEFLRDLNDSSAAGRERFMSWLEVDELSRLLAFVLVCGDPYHMSGVHNQFWYEDPTSGKLHPIVWDVRLLDLEKPPPGSNINRFWRAALEDPRVWDGAMREVAKWLEGDKLFKLAEERVNRAWEKYEAEFEYDSLRAGVVPPVGDPKTTLATLRKNLDTLRRWMSDVAVQCAVTPLGDARRSFLVDVAVSGHVGAQLSSVELSDSYGAIWRLSIFEAGDDSRTLHLPLASAETTGDIFGHAEASLSIPLRSRVDVQDGKLLFAETSHRIRVELAEVFPDDDPDRPRPDVRLRFSRALDGIELEAKPLPPGAVMAAVHTVRRADATPADPVYLHGDVRLDSDLVTSPSQPLLIEFGTRITLAPDVSILAEGRVLALGTAEQPITITASDPNLPWGVFALQGEGANGSRFKHVKFERGGGGQVERVEYKGMVCVHNARDVVFDHCEFSNNQRCDDAINIVKADASITNSYFHDTNADSIDYDMSSGLVAFNRIERSGNDGLDLMTCWPRVVGNTISDSGDKGLSVGEDSRPLVLNNTILRCNKGLEIKDRSEPLIAFTLVEGGPVGIDANKKNWRYGEAGWPTFVRSSIEGRESAFAVRDDAKHTLAQSRLGGAEFVREGHLGWLYAQFGFEPHSDEIGPAPRLALTAPRAPLHELRFEEDFLSPTDGWRAHGGVTRLVKRKRDLVATLRGVEGACELDVDWDLRDEALRYELVVEASTEDLASAEVTLSSDAANFTRSRLFLCDAPNQYRYTAIQLPAGAYRELRFLATPNKVGRLRVHSVRVVAWPLTSD